MSYLPIIFIILSFINILYDIRCYTKKSVTLNTPYKVVVKTEEYFKIQLILGLIPSICIIIFSFLFKFIGSLASYTIICIFPTTIVFPYLLKIISIKGNYVDIIEPEL
ncbi:hypothetical protein QYB59_001687 [Clostridium perfringens]|nr:hypothetical protein [Clostridium perfringens]